MPVEHYEPRPIITYIPEEEAEKLPEGETPGDPQLPEVKPGRKVVSVGIDVGPDGVYKTTVMGRRLTLEEEATYDLEIDRSQEEGLGELDQTER
ncbi:hypothetical protein ACFL0Y_00060 [Patescibacteria group bacterium]